MHRPELLRGRVAEPMDHPLSLFRRGFVEPVSRERVEQAPKCVPLRLRKRGERLFDSIGHADVGSGPPPEAVWVVIPLDRGDQGVAQRLQRLTLNLAEQNGNRHASP
jgi:hypothetical protein